MERVVSDHIWNYMETHSTETDLINTTDKWLSVLDQDKFVSLILDFTAAFDLIDYKILLKKWINDGLPKNAINWMKSYLNSRNQSMLMAPFLPHLQSVASHKGVASDHCCLLYTQMMQ